MMVFGTRRSAIRAPRQREVVRLSERLVSQSTIPAALTSVDAPLKVMIRTSERLDVHNVAPVLKTESVSVTGRSR